jgi:hypothetical protein
VVSRIPSDALEELVDWSAYPLDGWSLVARRSSPVDSDRGALAAAHPLTDRGRRRARPMPPLHPIDRRSGADAPAGFMP